MFATPAVATSVLLPASPLIVVAVLLVAVDLAGATSAGLLL